MAVKVGIGADISGFKQGTSEVRRDLADMAKSPDRMVKMGVDTREVDAALGKFGITTAKVAVKADGVESAIASIQKLEDALVKTGQIGKSLGHIKFNTKASAEFNRSLLNIQENYRAINRTAFGKDVNRRLEATGQTIGNPLDIDWLKAYSGDDVQADKAYRRYVGKLEHGAKFEPDAPPKWEKPAWKQLPPQPAQPQQVQQSAPRGFGGNLFGYLRQGVGFGLGLAGINSLGSLIGDAVSSETGKREAENLIFKRGSGYDDWGELDSAIGRLAKATMMTSTEVSRLSAEYVRAANATGDFAGDIEQEIQGAAQLGRGYGMDPRMSVEAFGRIAGVGFAADKSSQREFAGLLANTISASGMSARGEQVMGDLAGQVQRIADSEGRVMSAGEMAGFAQTLASLYSNPALRGAGAGNVIGGMNELTKGANATGQLMLWNAFAKTGGKGYIQFEHFKNADAFDQFEGKSKLDLMWPQIQRSANVLPGDVPEEQRLAFVMHEMVPAISMQMGEAIARARTDMERSGRSFGGFTQWATQATGKPIEDIAPGAWRDLTKLYKDSSSVNWRTEAERYLQNDTLASGDRDRLKSALEQFNDGQEGTLREILPQLMAKAGMPQTEADRMIAADNELKDALRDLLSPLRDLKTVIEQSLIPPLTTISSTLKKWLDPEPMPKADQAKGITWEKLPGETEEQWRERQQERIGKNPLGSAVGWALDKMIPPAHASMGEIPGYTGYLSKLERERNLPEGILGKVMMQESGGRNQGYHYKDGPTNPKHSDFGLFGIKKDYTGKDPGYGVEPLHSDLPLEQARFAADYLAAMAKQTGSIEGGLAAFHTGPKDWNSREGRDYVRRVMRQGQPERLGLRHSIQPAGAANLDGIIDETGRMGAFGYHAYGKLQDRRGFIMHHTGGRGTVDSVLKTFGERDFPAHYVIDREGQIHQALPAGMRGQHIRSGSKWTPLGRRLGLSNANTEGVEIIAKDDEDVLPGQIAAADKLRKMLGYRRDQVFGHGEINIHKQHTEGHSAAEAVRRSAPDEDKPVVPAAPRIAVPDDKPAIPTAPRIAAIDEDKSAIPVAPRIAVPDEDKPAIPSTPPLAFKSDLNRNMGELASVIPKADMPKLPEIEAPKTPQKLEALTQANTIQQPANARLQGQVDVNMTLLNDRGDVLHQRNGVLVSEPSLHGSHGSTGYTNRLVYADSSAQR